MGRTSFIKQIVKGWIHSCRPLKAFAIAIYQMAGRRPWSFGYSFYKYSYVRRVIMERLELFRLPQVPAQYGSGLDERCVEYPWFFSRLGDTDRRILDAGSSLNHHDLLNLPVWNNRELYITTLADEGQPKTRLKPIYVYEDLRSLSFAKEFFDAVVCISTLEHVGMDNTFLYTSNPEKKESTSDAHLIAVDEMKRVLKKGGSLFLTMPYGQYRNLGWFQVFNASMVEKVIQRFAPETFGVTYYKYNDGEWRVSTQEDCQTGYYVDIHLGANYTNASPAASQCVVCLQLTK